MPDKTFTVGGLKVTRHCSQQEMDEFVAKLAPEQKKDVKDVLQALMQAGLISIEQQ